MLLIWYHIYIQEGNLSHDIQPNKPFIAGTKNVCYLEYDSVLEIDKGCNVYYELSYMYNIHGADKMPFPILHKFNKIFNFIHLRYLTLETLNFVLQRIQ